VSIEDLWKQIRYIDKLNEKLKGFRILKSSEVDILWGRLSGLSGRPPEGTRLPGLFDSIPALVWGRPSRPSASCAPWITGISPSWDATGGLLLKRPGYEIDIERIIAHANENGCFFEINSSPGRLDLSAENARLAGSVRNQNRRLD
jgi:DNA polymerase (family 10)